MDPRPPTDPSSAPGGAQDGTGWSGARDAPGSEPRATPGWRWDAASRRWQPETGSGQALPEEFKREQDERRRQASAGQAGQLQAPQDVTPQWWAQNQAYQQWAYSQAYQQWAYQQWAAQQYAYQQWAYQQWAYQQWASRPGAAQPGAAQPQAAPPKRRGIDKSTLTAVTLVVVLLVFLIAVPIMVADPAVFHYDEQGNPVGGPDPGAAPGVDDTASDDLSPEPGDPSSSVTWEVTEAPIDPTREQVAYFADVGFGPGDRRDAVVRWAEPWIGVSYSGDYGIPDKTVVMNVVDDTNNTLDGPYLSLAGSEDAEVTVTFLKHDDFAVRAGAGSRDGASCTLTWNESNGRITSAEIAVDVDRPRRVWRNALYRAFAEAMGLGETARPRWNETAMFRPGNARQRYSSLDEAALRMLYDSRLEAGDSRAAAMRMWRNVP